jgi:transcriptional regulator with XRE-family HTH domain
MDASIPPEILGKLTAFGELLRYLRRRAGLTQTQLSVAVGYRAALAKVTYIRSIGSTRFYISSKTHPLFRVL